jgi:hypothetical protein
MRTFVYLKPIDHWIHVQVMVRVLNIGDNAWVAKGVNAGIPPGASDFESDTGFPDPELELGDGELRLRGTFPPGQRDMSCLFDLPLTTSEVRLAFRPWPRTAEVRVIAVAERLGTMSIDGFEPLRHDAVQGAPVVVTRRVAAKGETLMPPFEVALSGVVISRK